VKFKLIKCFEIVAFIYFFIGVLCGLQIQYSLVDFEIPEFISMFYVYTFYFCGIVYLIFGCILYKHRSFLMNLIDGILCFILTVTYPYPVFISIYEFNKYLYYFLGGCFSFLPVIFGIIDKKKIDAFHILKTVTRIFMITFIVLIILIINSCSAGISG
jgi:hypothetical protein